MDTAWIQVFVLTLTECVAPAGKTVCQERELELQFLTESDCKAALEQLVLESALSRAIEGGQLLLHYQPQFDAAGHLVGAEALIRWQHPDKGLIPPGDFIPLAEKTGLIVKIGSRMIDTSLRTKLTRLKHAMKEVG